MRFLINIVLLVSFFVSTQIKAQNRDSVLGLDTIYIDSVEVINNIFYDKLNKFYHKSIKDIDTNSFLELIIEPYSSEDSTLTFYIVVKKDIENKLRHLKNTCPEKKQYFEHCFFRIGNTLVFTSDLCNSNLLKKTGYKKKFYFKRKKRLYVCFRTYSTSTEYKIKTNRDNQLRFKRLYYMRESPTFIQKIYYSIFYRNYY